MKKVVFLTMDSLVGFECYDDLLIEPLNDIGWTVEKISWRKENVNWNNYNAVIVRSTWDYQSDSKKFLEVLRTVNNSSAYLENNFSILQWNMNKRYLYDLKQKNIRIPDTIWEKSFSAERAVKYFDLLNVDEIIIKPNISGNADNTFRLKRRDLNSCLPILQSIFGNREYLVQPFMKNIIDEGEYSLFYFGGKYSHTILKKPKANDFRVQEEHGGIIKLVQPTEEQLLQAENILNTINPLPLYARIDFVRTPDDQFALMELELIEPSLYFNMDIESPKRFAEIFNQWMKDH